MREDVIRWGCPSCGVDYGGHNEAAIKEGHFKAHPRCASYKPAAGPSEALPVAPSVSAEERLREAQRICGKDGIGLHGLDFDAASESVANALAAAHARGLERAAQLALLHGDGLSGEELAEAMREEARALAGTEAQPPPDARVKELLEALRAALELAAEGWSYAGEYFVTKWDASARITRLSSLLGASDPAEGK